MKTQKLILKYKVVGVPAAKKQIDSLTKSVREFFDKGQKYGVPKDQLLKMFTLNIDGFPKKIRTPK